MFEKNYGFTVFLLAWGKNVSTGLGIFLSFFPEKFFRPKISVLKKKFRNLFDVRVKIFRQDCQIQILHFQRKILGKNFPWEKFYVNSQSSFDLRVKNLRQVCKNCNFHSQRNIFEENFFWNTIWVHRFCSSFGWKNFSRFVRIAVYVCQRNIVGEKEKDFLEKNLLFIKFSGPREKNLSTVLSHSIPIFKKNSLR